MQHNYLIMSNMKALILIVEDVKLVNKSQLLGFCRVGTKTDVQSTSVGVQGVTKGYE